MPSQHPVTAFQLTQGEYVQSVLDIVLARRHPSAVDIGHGWLLLADRNFFKKVFFLSKYQAIIVPFEHGEPYHTFLRATMLAKIYADNNPQHPLPATQVEQLIYLPLLETKMAMNNHPVQPSIKKGENPS
jgi:hypothetical protein